MWSLHVSDHRLGSLPQNLPASLRYLQLDNNRFRTPSALPGNVSQLHSSPPAHTSHARHHAAASQQLAAPADPGNNYRRQQTRFIDAQPAIYHDVLAELLGGQKENHWMWFVFPQIAGLGESDMARRYAISGLEEARAYLAHPVLGQRLRECTGIVADLNDKTAKDIFGDPDHLKFHASMRLFAEAAATPAEKAPFEECLQIYFGGKRHPETMFLGT